MGIIDKTHDFFVDVSMKNKTVIVSFSGGKDSFVVLDLAKRYFKDVKCFFMYFVDGISFIEEQLDYAKIRYGVEIIKIPHWIFYQKKKYGVYCQRTNVPDIKLKDIYYYIRNETGIDIILTGAKRTDSIWRRQYTKNLGKDFDTILNPIWEWNKYEVLAYLKQKKIEIPHFKNIAGNSSGIDFTPSNMYDMYDNYHDDFLKIEQEFPFVGAIIKRRELYGAI